MEKKHLFAGIGSLLLATVFLFFAEPREEVSPAPKSGEAAIGEARMDHTPRHEEMQPRRGCRTDGTALSLENDFVQVKISPVGGGIRSVALRNYPAQRGSADPWIFDDYDEMQDALSLVLQTDGKSFPLANVPFEVEEHSPHSLRLRGSLPNGMAVERRYTIGNSSGEEDPYSILHELIVEKFGTSFSGNLGVEVSLGSLPPTAGDASTGSLGFMAYDGKKARFTALRSFDAGVGFLGIGRHGPREHIGAVHPTVWAAIKNQFFAAILTPTIPATATDCAPVAIREEGKESRGIGGTATLLLHSLSDFSRGAKFSYYVGPKEFVRLDRLGQNQDKVMQFGWFGFVSKILLFMMMGIHRLLPNWGCSIVLLTVLVKTLLWPLTTAQVRSSRAMVRLKEPLRVIQDRHRNNPQKKQAETLKLFRENGVNPAAGCLPIFIQIPIFLGLYYMLRSASELRFASFLWIRDLSAADTVGHLSGIPINPLPLLMAATTFWQMRMGTSTMPNKGMQRYVFAAMPFIFLFVCYGFPAGLVLYWTAQNVFTIGQQLAIQGRLKRLEATIAANVPEKNKKRKNRTSSFR
ncbi:MAG: membrane protein insertase YidC [Puniceicoccales bacterium]|jgi:YidC/Oxa1 family membrane protein insertase|nr:membrane protein insertase YidC [Puniceicoccales bacterium]